MHVPKCISGVNFRLERFVVPEILIVAKPINSTYEENCIVIVHLSLHDKQTMDFFHRARNNSDICRMQSPKKKKY